MKNKSKSTSGSDNPVATARVGQAMPAANDAPLADTPSSRARTPAPAARGRTINEAGSTESTAILRVNQGVKLRRDYMQAMKVLAAMQDRLMYELMEEAVSDLLAKYGARPTAR